MNPDQLDVIAFPDPIGATLDLLNDRFDGVASAEIPDRYTRHMLVTGTTHPATLVSRETTFIIECRDRQSPLAAAALASDASSYLEAVCRLGGDPFGYVLHSLVMNYPDPDDGCPRSVLTCSMSWSRAD